jgi:hypothetical protein
MQKDMTMAVRAIRIAALAAILFLIVVCAPPLSPMLKVYDLSFSDPNPVFIINEKIAPDTLSYKGERATSISLNPNLPIDLQLNLQTGIISGIPRYVFPRTHLVATVTNKYGSDTVGIDITVSHPAPESISYPLSSFTFVIGSPIVPLIPQNKGGAPDSFSIEPTLPSGLTINKSTGIIQGTPTTAINAVTTYQVTARNAAGFSSAFFSITVADTANVASETDHIPPVIRFFDPAHDSMAVSQNSRAIKVVAKDQNGISSVWLKSGADSIPASKSEDSIWSATINNLSTGFNNISIYATDASIHANLAVINMIIKYDPTLPDNTPPIFTHISGPSSDTLVRDSIITIMYEIHDTSGIDSVFWRLNGVFASPMIKMGGYDHRYRLVDTLRVFHINRLTIFAIDNSANKNVDSISIILDYNTLPANISQFAPANGAVDIENSGFKFAWSGGDDPDGDSVMYIVKYGTSPSNLVFSGLASSKQLMPVPMLKGGTQYYWAVQVCTKTDTILNPSAGTYSFATKNHPASITSRLADDTISINDSLLLRITAADPEGVLKYEWDLGDGQTQETNGSSIMHRFASDSGIISVIVAIVDSAGGKTYDTALIAITNRKPIVKLGNDTISGLNDPVPLQSNIIDDGTHLTYEWAIARKGAFSPDSFHTRSKADTIIRTPDENLPDSIMCVLKVTDDDGNTGMDTIIIRAEMRWTRECKSDSILGNRYGKAILNYANKIWMIAGGPFGPGQTSYNDVWSSDDGKNWKCEASATGFTRRLTGGVVFNNKMWIIGGAYLINPSIGAYRDTNDVWYSSDGKTWLPATGNGGFQEINSRLVHQNKIFIASQNQVWSSSDGSHWGEEQGNFPGGTMLSFKDTLWAISDSMVWFSYDGRIWSKRNTNNTFPIRIDASFGIYNNLLWRSGGILPDASDQLSDEIFCSENGGTWKIAQRNPAFGNRGGHTFIAGFGKLWVFDGFLCDPQTLSNCNYVWSTDDMP